MASLTEKQLESYRQDGFVFPLDLFSTEETEVIRSELFHVEEDSQDPLTLKRYLSLNAHYVFPFAARVASHPPLLDAVESILGPNLMVWGSELFAKDGHSPSYVSWHQDLTYWGLGATDHQVTAWLALSDVDQSNGCMRFVPGSHKPVELLDPIETFAPNNELSRGQELPLTIHDDQTVDVCLAAGQVSLHHGRLYHASGPNESHQRRLGLTIRYITPDVIPSKLGKDYAMLVRGENRSAQLETLPPPRETLGEAERERFEMVAAHQNLLYEKPGDQQPHKFDRLRQE